MVNWIRENRVPFCNSLFFAAYGIYLVVSILNVSFLMASLSWTLFKVILAGVMGLVLVREALLREWDLRSGLILLGAVLFCLFQWNLKVFFIPGALLVFTARRIPFERIARFTIPVCAVTLVAVILCAELGLCTNMVTQSDGRIRDYLGFRYVLYPGIIMTNLTLLAVYLRQDRLKWWEGLGLLLASFLVYLATDSRMNFLLAVLALLLAVFLKRKPGFLEHRPAFRKASAFSFLFWALISIPLMLFFTKDSFILHTLDNLLSNRLYLANFDYKVLGIHLFGSPDFQMTGSGLDLDGKVYAGYYNYLDNLYVQILIVYGVVLFVLALALITHVMWKLADQDKRGYLLGIFVLLALQAFIQDSFWFLWYNTFLFVLADVWYGKARTEEPANPAPPPVPRARKTRERSPEEELIEQIAREVRHL